MNTKQIIGMWLIVLACVVCITAIYRLRPQPPPHPDLHVYPPNWIGNWPQPGSREFKNNTITGSVAIENAVFWCSPEFQAWLDSPEHARDDSFSGYEKWLEGRR